MQFVLIFTQAFHSTFFFKNIKKNPLIFLNFGNRQTEKARPIFEMGITLVETVR